MFDQVMQSHANSQMTELYFIFLDRDFKSSDTMTKATGTAMHQKA